MDLLTKLKGLSYLGWGTLFRSVAYGVSRDWQEWRHPARRAGGAVVLPGAWQGWEELPGGGRARFERAELEVVFLAPDLVRLTWTPGTLPVPYAIARQEWPQVELGRGASPGGGVHLASAALALRVGADGALRLEGPGGAVLRQDLPPERRGQAWRLTSPLRPEEHVYGMGERTAGFNLRGGTYRLWNREAKGAYAPGDDPLYLGVPVTLSLHDGGAVLAFYENSSDARVDLAGEAARATFSTGALRLYLAAGTPRSALARYCELTGAAPLPPLWALGFHQARWSYLNQAEVRAVAEGFRSRGLPLSAIHLDIHYMNGHRVFSVDRRRFPDLGRLARDLEGQGVRLVAILDPGVKEDRAWPLYLEGLERDAYCKRPDGRPVRAPVWPGTCVFPDFTSPRARAWWASLYRGFADWGLSGAWHDMNEPAAFSAWGVPTLPECTRHDLDGRGGTHLEAHNLYGLLEARAGFEGLRAARPDKRPWILSRSGWAGLQRWAWSWTGDSESTWWTLRQSLRMALSLGLTGNPYSGPDVGGFGGVPTPELMVRWFQLSSCLPFFRVHSAFFTPRREPWCFDEVTQSYLGSALRLRYRLLPHWYTLAWEASRTGLPLVRPMLWSDPADRELWDLDDQFLLGDDLLVAPVMQEGARAREVLLPAGRWYRVGSPEPPLGPGRVTVEAPLEGVPLFARAGSVLPFQEGEALELHLFLPQDGPGGGQVYADAGDGYGEWRVDRLVVQRQGTLCRVARESEGAFPWPWGESTRLVVHGAHVESASVDGRMLRPEGEALRVGEFGEIRLTLR
jgi:alpha-glucosidase